MKILILGGGIRGLGAAWTLRKKYPRAAITLLEKEGRLGGWMQTSHEGGFLFERGPRTFPLGKSPLLLNLIRDLGLEIFIAKPQARYLWHRGKLRSIGSFFPKFLPYLLREPFIPRSIKSDESIYDFAARRFSPEIAETFFDPMTLGIYAGDIRQLSIKACFPTLAAWEQKWGSVVWGFLRAPRRAKGLFTVRNGMSALIEALQKRIEAEIVLHCEVKTVREGEVFAGGKLWQADQIIDARPPKGPAKSLWVVHLAFPGDVLRKKGFGYLIPTQERESVLGVIFDSCVFPKQNRGDETRLTAMVRAEEKDPLGAALEAVFRHLQIADSPLYSTALFAKEAIRHFSIGCGEIAAVSVEEALAPKMICLLS